MGLRVVGLSLVAGLVSWSVSAGAATDVVNFQAFRQEQTTTFSGADRRDGTARLVNLNAGVNGWYLLFVKWPGASAEVVYNLERPDVKSYDLAISGRGLTVTIDGRQTSCDVFSDPGVLKGATGEAYVALCEGRVLVRNQARGSAGDMMSWGAGVLRDTLGSTGDSIVGAVKELREDSGLLRGETSTTNEKAIAADRPARARVATAAQSTALTVPDLNLELESSGRSLLAGAWYRAKNSPGFFFSAIQPSFVEESILSSYRDRVNALDSVESSALSYMVALDLSKFEIGWAHGTKLPGVAWSPAQSSALRTGSGAGPDGFDSVSPLVLTGKLNPSFLPRLAGVMCGGFQRLHGVFRSGALSKVNGGSYYGFIENGVMLSRMNPGLATAISYIDGRFDIKTWTEKDADSISKIRYARQNGVPLVETDASGNSIPGALVKRWGDGNWSGSAASQKRSQRAGACISEQGGRRYLIYGYFSSANPDAMAQVFRSYGCQYAIHLDMNSAGQGYLGLFSSVNGRFLTETPVREMSARNTKMKLGDKSVAAPRYVGQSDEADFFYFLRK